MFQIFQEEKVVTICMLAFLGSSLFIRLLLGFLYQRMIKEADNMAATRNRLLKKCKLKFANCYQLSNGVANIPVFVDKFLNRLSIGPFTFETLYHLSGQIMLLSVMAAGVGIYRSIMAGRTLGDILPFYIVSFFGLYLYFSISAVVDIPGKKRVLKVNLVDYLENHLSPRIDITQGDLEMLYGDDLEEVFPAGQLTAGSGKRQKRAEEFIPIAAAQPVVQQPEPVPMQPQPQMAVPVQTAEPDYLAKKAEVTEEELEALLKEFLTN